MRKLTYLISVFLMLSCLPTAHITTTNLQNLASYEPGSNIYVLPQTKILIKATAIRKNFTPGPYNQFAKRLLGIENVHSEAFESWDITDIRLSTICEPDPDYYFSVKQEGVDLVENKLLELSKTGLVVNPSLQPCSQMINNESVKPDDQNYFTDLTIKPYFYDPSKKKQKNLLADSAFSKIPSLKKQLEPKKLEEKANEAANFILKIRKRRFKLMAGQYEVYPEGIALKTSVEELTKLEEEYLSLFIGKAEIDTLVRNYTILPKSGEKLQRHTAFRFSNETGFFTASEEQGTPVVIEVEDLNTNDILNSMELKSASNSYSNVLIYRIPDRALVKVLYGSRIIVESEFLLYQFGALVPIDVTRRK